MKTLQVNIPELEAISFSVENDLDADRTIVTARFSYYAVVRLENELLYKSASPSLILMDQIPRLAKVLKEGIGRELEKWKLE